MRFVLDTNVVVSGLISRAAGAAPRALLEALVDGQFESVASAALVDEWRAVALRPRVRRYLQLDDTHLWAILAADPAAVPVTGDGPLLDAPFAPGRVITPREAIQRLQRAGGRAATEGDR